jgi:hypothetical protein
MSEDFTYTTQQEREFLIWLRNQKSCISGKPHNIQACHVRRVAYGAGTSIKPRLFAVPMTGYEHHIQSVNGEVACLTNFLPDWKWRTGTRTPLQDAKLWFENKALNYRATFLSL